MANSADDDTEIDGGKSRERQLTHEQAAAVVSHIAGLTKSGLALPGGLRALSGEVAPRGMRHVLLELAQRLEGGESLDAALVQLGPRFPDHLRGLVSAGVQAGRLAEVLSQYVHHYRLAQQLRHRTTMSLIYPAVLFSAFLALFGFMMLVFVPALKNVCTEIGAELPPITLWVITISEWCFDYGAQFLVILLAAAVLLWFLDRLQIGRVQQHRLRHRVPFVGPLWRSTALAEFARLLALLVEREMPLPQALRLAASGSADAEVADTGRAIAKEIEAGHSLRESEARRTRLPAGLAQSLQSESTAQALSDSLQLAAEMMECRARVRSEFIARAAAPLTMVLIVLLLAVIVSALFMPIFHQMTNLSG